MRAETFKSLDTKAVAAAYHDAVASASTEGRPAFDIASDDLRNQTEAARKLEEMKRRRNAAIRNAPPAMRRRGSVSGIDEGDLMAALAASDAAPPEEDDSEEDELPQQKEPEPEPVRAQALPLNLPLKFALRCSHF